ncbi:MAG: FAD-binding oxidoreductase [Bauldia sp.]|nr:FAD-binding oxidoreductase [Bauldia sp.]
MSTTAVSPARRPTPLVPVGLKGTIFTPDHPGYEAARVVFYGNIDKRPGAVVRVADAMDVAKVVNFARDKGLELAIRGGGHSVAGHSTTEGGVVIDLRALKNLEIDAGNRTAWVDAGLTAAEVTSALAAEGLAIGFGDAGSVGVGGITLGGGVGFLARKYGLTIDSLLAAEIVTADGQLVRTDAETHPDLFWAIRGGGGNFGVATRFQFRLQPLPSFVGGLLVLPATAETIAGFIAAAEAAPEELSTIANVMPAPPLPFLPAELHGSLVIFAMLAFAGDAEAAAPVLAPFRALARPLADMVRPMGLHEMYPPEDPSYRPTAVAQTMFVETIDRRVADTILGHLKASDAPMRVAQLRVLGGAVARVPTAATAYAHRGSRIMVNVAAFYKGAEERIVRTAQVDALATALRQSDDGAYVNFLTTTAPERIRAAYPGGTWERLRAVKAKYDPGNLFRVNQNIPPA